MANWLWIDELDSRNDWMELISLTFAGQTPGSGGGQTRGIPLRDAVVEVRPGRFTAAILRRAVRGTSSSVWAALGPQLEIEFIDAILTGTSTSGKDRMTLFFNSTKTKSTFNGKP